MEKLPSYIVESLDSKNIIDPGFETFIIKNFNQLADDSSRSITKFQDNLDKYYYYFKNKEVLSPIGEIKPENVNIQKSNDFYVVVQKPDDFIPAIKDILWKLNNKPSTTATILKHIYLLKNETMKPYLETVDDKYKFINSVFRLATHKGDIDLFIQKSKTGKDIYLYKNKTDKRYGYYLDGKLHSLKELSAMCGVGIATIQKRLSKNPNVENAIRPV
jgi:hypothetical protein